MKKEKFNEEAAKKINKMWSTNLKPRKEIIDLVDSLKTCKGVEQSISKYDLPDQHTIMKLIFMKYNKVVKHTYETDETIGIAKKLLESEFFLNWSHNNQEYLLYYPERNNKIEIKPTKLQLKYPKLVDECLNDLLRRMKEINIDKNNKINYYSIYVGYCIGKGLSIEEAFEFSSFAKKVQ